ncbi:MAG TPA: xanthine dehydrogenase family protein subunit M [Steroidobacteraceae bacterium]|nr:xanthine dehydrogenase family protein subunit M [Steroidobacteraceae bacterium]
MKAPSFAYAKPHTPAEVFDLLERPGARVLAGGQSLIPSLNLRLSAPELLVDITGLAGLRGIALEQDVVRIGALTTHADIERSAEMRKHVPLLADAAAHVAHPAIRNRGTFGGSVALADPAAEYPACLVALDATIVLRSKDGERMVQAEDFFKGLFEVDLRPGEIVAAAEIPALLKDERSVFSELARRHGDYAIVGLAGVTTAAQKRIAFFGLGAKPVLLKPRSLDEAKAALPPATPDLYHSAATKAHLAKVLLERAWTRL